MIKFKQGCITNPDTGTKKDIIVKAKAPNNIKDTLIGGGLVLIGITYLTATAFRNGSAKFDEAEMQVFEDLGLIKD